MKIKNLKTISFIIRLDKERRASNENLKLSAKIFRDSSIRRREHNKQRKVWSRL
jgi:hypothetical protein